MRKKERFDALISYFTESHPEPETELHYENPFQLLVAVVLSAQCTDKRVNIVTPALFRDFPAPEYLAVSSFDELAPYIKSISYPNNKTKHLLGLGKMLVEDFNSEVPATVEELQKLPGVGRKTANVIASVIYNLPTMAVDTHVFRVSKRIGLVTQTAKTPLEVEKQLVRHIPEDLIPKAHHWLILHGRYVCLARKPKCEKCDLTSFCRFYEKKMKAEKLAESLAKDSDRR
ncbi:endonuclease III [Roseivirga sp. BDSF3-8]|uniref:endonuclease III n=1 Tax=Roseivirga sp. BDSF3-8 TaxID=3241598 RepID=UPI003531A5DB